MPLEARFQKPDEDLIAALPDWFGAPEANAAYARDLARLPSWLALRGETLLGASTLASHFPGSFEIHFLAVHPAEHRRGIGRRLVGISDPGACRGSGAARPGPRSPPPSAARRRPARASRG